MKFSNAEKPLTKLFKLSKFGISIILSILPEASSGKHSLTNDSISGVILIPNSAKNTFVSFYVNNSLLKSQKLDTNNELNIKNKDTKENTNAMNPNKTKQILTNPIFLF